MSRVRERHPGIAIWVGRGDSLRAGSTLDLLAQALRDALGICEGEPLTERVDRIRARVAERVPPRDQRRVAEFLVCRKPAGLKCKWRWCSRQSWAHAWGQEPPAAA